jgi:hypothetical protein
MRPNDRLSTRRRTRLERIEVSPGRRPLGVGEWPVVRASGCGRPRTRRIRHGVPIPPPGVSHLAEKVAIVLGPFVAGVTFPYLQSARAS